MKRILDCKIFEDYTNKKYEVKVKHRIFGKYEMRCVISGLIDDEEMGGIIVHGKEIYCYKQDHTYRFIEKDDRVIMSDGLMEICIKI